MSDKEIKDSNKDLADAEFEAFLQGGDELALLLQELPQDTPSAELDAAIMADAEAALVVAEADATTPVIAAANDAKNPDASSHRPSFLWRWKTPLGLVASVMLAVPIFLSHQEHEAVLEAAHTTQTPEKNFYPQDVKNSEIAAAPPVAAIPQATPAPQAEAAGKIAAKDDSAESKARTERRADAEMKPAPAKPVSPAPPAPVTASPAPIVLAEAPAPRATAGIANEKPSELVRTAEEERTRRTESFKTAAKEEAPKQLAKMAEADGRLQATTPHVVARSAPAAVIVPAAPAARAAMDSMLADKKADMQGNNETRIIVPLSVQPLAAVPPAEQPNAHDWLTKIEKLLKEKQNREALREWRNFRTIYPDFVVDKSLQKKIDALQK